MVARRRPALIFGMAALLLAGSSAWLVAAGGDTDPNPPDSTAGDAAVTVYEDLDDDEGVVISGEIAREIHRAIAEALDGVDEAMAELRGLSVRVEPRDRDRSHGRVRIRVDDDGDVREAIVDPIEIQRQVDEALQQVDFERMGVDLERSMEQLGDELGRMGEELGRAFEGGHWKHDQSQRTADLAGDDDQADQADRADQQHELDAEVRRLRREIRALEREILRLQARRGDQDSRDFD